MIFGYLSVAVSPQNNIFFPKASRYKSTVPFYPYSTNNSFASSTVHNMVGYNYFIELQLSIHTQSIMLFHPPCPQKKKNIDTL